MRLVAPVTCWCPPVRGFQSRPWSCSALHAPRWCYKVTLNWDKAQVRTTHEPCQPQCDACFALSSRCAREGHGRGGKRASLRRAAASCHRAPSPAIVASYPRASLSLLPLPSKIRSRQALAYYATHTTTFGTFVAVLCASRRPREPPDAGAAADGEVAGDAAAASCVLQKLDAHGVYFAINFKKMIAEFAGVQMGPEAIRHKATLDAP